MPHLTFDYSSNLEREADLAAFCVELSATLLATGLFELGALRVRGHRCEVYAIADRLPENAFLDMTLRMGTGRSEADRRRVGEALFDTASRVFGELLERPNFALSLEIREIDAAFSWKRNSIHPRLRGR